MNYYELEKHMFDRHHEMVRKAEARRLVMGELRPAHRRQAGRQRGFFATVGETLRALRPRLGDA